MPEINLTDSRLYYQDIYPDKYPGSKAASAVVLLHGLGADSSSWSYQIPVLQAAGFRVVVPDVPGFGKSTRPAHVRTIPGLTRFLPDLCSRLGLNQVDLVGLSMGGTLALQFTLDCPRIVRRLILVNTFAHLDILNLRTLPYYVGRFVSVHLMGLPAQANIVAMRIFPLPKQAGLRQILIQQILQTDPAHYRMVLRALARFNVENKLSTISCPALVISGSEDTTVPIALQKSLASGIPAARSVTLEGAGHASTVDQPEAFNKVMLQFLCA